jgi:uncharacterized DUF497 family protein
VLLYEWDDEKAAANHEKHGVSFIEATGVFLDPLAATWPDPEHSLGEPRFITVGHSQDGQLLVVAHLDVADDRIRLISARRATKRERHAHQEAR